MTLEMAKGVGKGSVLNAFYASLCKYNGPQHSTFTPSSLPSLTCYPHCFGPCRERAPRQQTRYLPSNRLPACLHLAILVFPPLPPHSISLHFLHLPRKPETVTNTALHSVQNMLRNRPLHLNPPQQDLTYTYGDSFEFGHHPVQQLLFEIHQGFPYSSQCLHVNQILSPVTRSRT